MPSSGKGDKCVYLVYGSKYELLGLAPTQEASHRLGSKYGLPFRVVGPITQNEFIDWEAVGEEAFGENHGPSVDYINMVDGRPYVEPVEPLTKAQARALPPHAKGH